MSNVNSIDAMRQAIQLELSRATLNKYTTYYQSTKPTPNAFVGRMFVVLDATKKEKQPRLTVHSVGD